MEKSQVSQINKITAALIDILQRHEDTIYRMQILINAIGGLARESLARTGLSPEQCEQRFLEILGSVKEFAPPPQHPNVDAEVRDILKDAEKLERLLDGYMN